eukprot:126105-Rhodomonas_salina.1
MPIASATRTTAPSSATERACLIPRRVDYALSGYSATVVCSTAKAYHATGCAASSVPRANAQY